jgi:hypothetical protein
MKEINAKIIKSKIKLILLNLIFRIMEWVLQKKIKKKYLINSVNWKKRNRLSRYRFRFSIVKTVVRIIS